MKLEGRSAIVTGGSQGLGRAIAEAYLDEGANVLICARSADTLHKTHDDLAGRAKPGRSIRAVVADVAKPADADRLMSEALALFGRVDILVNNAGVYGPMGAIEEVDWGEWFKSVEINLMGTVLPCRAVLPHFKKQGYGKIINLSGGGATAPLPRISAYAASKAAVVRFTETIAEELRADHVDVNAIAPGALNTRLLEQVLQSGPEKVGESFYRKSLKQAEDGGTALSKGAELCVFLASSASDGLSGKLLSAVWDPWDELPEKLPGLNKSDIYTLRRIVPKDRGEGWG
jgi:3-oxoacyl-[acyl-carrier protein] reductase